MANKKWQGSKWIRPEKRKRIYQRDDFTCVYCGESIFDSPDVVLTLDHVVARELGGSNHETNLVTACRSCNSSKRHLKLGQFLQYLADQGVDHTQVRKNVRNAQRRALPKKANSK